MNLEQPLNVLLSLTLHWPKQSRELLELNGAEMYTSLTRRATGKHDGIAIQSMTARRSGYEPIHNTNCKNKAKPSLSHSKLAKLVEVPAFGDVYLKGAKGIEGLMCLHGAPSVGTRANPSRLSLPICRMNALDREGSLRVPSGSKIQ